jgi:hypothetical protein
MRFDMDKMIDEIFWAYEKAKEAALVLVVGVLIVYLATWAYCLGGAAGWW